MFEFLKRLFSSDSDKIQPPTAEPPTAEPTPAASPTGVSEPEPTPAAAAASRSADYVIVGAGPAGVGAAETLAGLDPESSILLIAGEAAPPYSRMAIPYVLTGLIEEPGTYLRKAGDHYESSGIEVIHSRVERVDAEAKSLRLSDGGTCGYGKLLVATGASPIKPPIEGLDLPGVHHCWTLEDCRAIAEKASEGASVVLIGAGFIGCIILESLASRGVKLTVIEALDRMVPRMLNETAGNLIKNWCQAKGIVVTTSTSVARVSQAGDGLTVETDKGESIAADLVVVAAGVRSNTGFLAGSGVTIEDGIRVDDRLATGVGDIYAAGDCAQGPDFSTGGWSVHAIQTTAAEHGRIAALNMAGREAVYKGSLNMNVLDTAGLIAVSFGSWDGVPGGESAEVLDAESYRYTRLEFDGERLVGALCLGRTDHIGVLRGLIQTRVRLGAWKDKLIKDPNRLVEAYVARTQ